MATIVTWAGSQYTVPGTGEDNWGGATKVDGLLISLVQNGFNRGGGTFNLLADVDFGSNGFGLKSTYYKSRTATVATAGILRLAEAEGIGWRDHANTGNNLLTTDASDRLTYNGGVIASSAGVIPASSGGTGVTGYTTGDLLYAGASSTVLSKLAIGSANKALTSTGSAPQWGFLVNANIDAAAAIAYSKLNLAASVAASDLNSGVAASNAVLTADGAGGATFITPPTFPAQAMLNNLTIAASVAANALTIAMKDMAGNDPDGSSTASLGFRSTTATSGVFTNRTVTSALSVVVPSGTTIGTADGVRAFLYVYAIDNAGTVELAVSLFRFDEGSIQSSSAISGGTSATTLYSTTARTSKAIRLLGRIDITTTTAGTWAQAPTEVANMPCQCFQQVTVQRLTSGSSTYNRPAGVRYLRVRLVGGGGGGAGSGTSAGGAGGTGGTGGTTTFGTSLLTATGGVGGTAGFGGGGGAGGTATVASPAVSVFAQPGGAGQGVTFIGSAANSPQVPGAPGAPGPWGGAGGGVFGAAGVAAATNSGAGGGGGGISQISAYSGASGGAGAYVEALIYNPASTYSYAVGAAGTAGSAGASGFVGGAGGSGLIVIEEHYF